MLVEFAVDGSRLRSSRCSSSPTSAGIGAGDFPHLDPRPGIHAPLCGDGFVSLAEQLDLSLRTSLGEGVHFPLGEFGDFFGRGAFVLLGAMGLHGLLEGGEDGGRSDEGIIPREVSDVSVVAGGEKVGVSIAAVVVVIVVVVVGIDKGCDAPNASRMRNDLHAPIAPIATRAIVGNIPNDDVPVLRPRHHRLAIPRQTPHHAKRKQHGRLPRGKRQRLQTRPIFHRADLDRPVVAARVDRVGVEIVANIADGPCVIVGRLGGEFASHRVRLGRQGPNADGMPTNDISLGHPRRGGGDATTFRFVFGGQPRHADGVLVTRQGGQARPGGNVPNAGGAVPASADQPRQLVRVGRRENPSQTGHGVGMSFERALQFVGESVHDPDDAVFAAGDVHLGHGQRRFAIGGGYGRG
mmetsp:Transcript_12110/g.26368  ORF Transcript_12110/g.26368 Transcript_12110/m.26368 type:complete len:409 (-) Transcript_12110:28-1254(-)